MGYLTGINVAGRSARLASRRLRRWWLQYQLQWNEGDLAGIEREWRVLDEERRIALRRNLGLRSALSEVSRAR